MLRWQDVALAAGTQRAGIAAHRSDRWTQAACKLRILIVTDAWAPQINGVVVTLRNTMRELERMGPRGRD